MVWAMNNLLCISNCQLHFRQLWFITLYVACFTHTHPPPSDHCLPSFSIPHLCRVVAHNSTLLSLLNTACFVVEVCRLDANLPSLYIWRSFGQNWSSHYEVLLVRVNGCYRTQWEGQWGSLAYCVQPLVWVMSLMTASNRANTIRK